MMAGQPFPVPPVNFTSIRVPDLPMISVSMYCPEDEAT